MALHPTRTTLPTAAHLRRLLVRPVVMPVALIALLVALLPIGTGLRAIATGAPALAAGDPATTYGAYLDAWRAGDLDRAWSLLTPSAQHLVGRPAFDASWRRPLGSGPFVAWAEGATRIDGDRATVRVAIARSERTFPWPSRTVDHRTIAFQQTGGVWLIASPDLGPDRWY